MDERQRKVFEKARAILDRSADDEREHQEWRGRHYDKITERYDLGEDEEIVEPPQQLQQPASALPLTDAMLDARIANAIRESSIAPQVNEALAVVAKALDNLHKMIESDEKKIVELREEVAGLRADQTIMRTINANRNVFGVVRKEAKSNVA